MVCEHRITGQCLEGDRGDEVGRRLGHCNLHRGTLLDQQANQFGGLIGGNAAADAERNVFSRQFHANDPISLVRMSDLSLIHIWFRAY